MRNVTSETMKVDRRSFLQFSGFTLAGALMGKGARKWILPYEKPYYASDGTEEWATSICRQCPAGCGIRVRKMDGWPVSIEGNPDCPISRGKLLLAKALTGLLVSAVVVLVSAISITSLVKAVGLVVPSGHILFAVLLAALLALLFGMIAFCLSAMGAAGRGASIGVACLVGLGSYIIASLESVVDWLSWPAKILPYHYYNPTEVLNGFYAWKVASVFTTVILILGIISWLSFRRRDINS